MKWIVLFVGLFLISISHATILDAQRAVDKLPELDLSGIDINELAKEVASEVNTDVGENQPPDESGDMTGPPATAQTTGAPAPPQSTGLPAPETSQATQGDTSAAAETSQAAQGDTKAETTQATAEATKAEATQAATEKEEDATPNDRPNTADDEEDDDDDEEDEEPKSAMQDVSFDKEFDMIIPPGKKDQFLDECSKKMNTLAALCVDVKKGSVVISIGGEKEKVVSASNILVSNGFSLPSFGDLGKGVLKGQLQPSDLDFPQLPLPGVPTDPVMAAAAAGTTSAPADTTAAATTSAPPASSSAPAETSQAAPMSSAPAESSQAPPTSSAPAETSQAPPMSSAPAETSQAATSSQPPPSISVPPSSEPPATSAAAETTQEASSAAPAETTSQEASSAAPADTTSQEASSAAPAETSIPASSEAPAESTSQAAPPETSAAPPATTSAAAAETSEAATSAAPALTEPAPSSSAAAVIESSAPSAPADTSEPAPLTPSMPEVPSMPAAPNMPSAPTMPEMPSVPTMPATPDVGDITGGLKSFGGDLAGNVSAGNFSVPQIDIPFAPKVNFTMPKIEITFNDWEELMSQLLRDEDDEKWMGITIPWGYIEWYGTMVIFLLAHMVISYNHYRIYDKTYKYGKYQALIKCLLAIKLTYVISYTIYLITTKNTGGKWWQCVIGFLSYFTAGFLELSGGPYCKVLCDPWSALCFLIWIPLLNWLAFIWAVAVFAFVQLGLTLIQVGVLWFLSPDGLEMKGLLPR